MAGRKYFCPGFCTAFHRTVIQLFSSCGTGWFCYYFTIIPCMSMCLYGFIQIYDIIDSDHFGIILFIRFFCIAGDRYQDTDIRQIFINQETYISFVASSQIWQGSFIEKFFALQIFCFQTHTATGYNPSVFQSDQQFCTFLSGSHVRAIGDRHITHLTANISRIIFHVHIF